MTEDPTKLFSTRAERYPKPDGDDAVYTAVNTVIGKVPVFGDIINYVMPQFWGPPVQSRLEEWFKELANDFDNHKADFNKIKEKVEDFKLEDIAKNESFITASLQATRIAIGTHRQEKREYLRNALLNIALGNGPNDDLQLIFFNSVEEFSVSHVKVLEVLWTGTTRMAQQHLWDIHSIPIRDRNYRNAFEVLIPELKGESNLVEYILVDLRNRGFASLTGTHLSYPQGNTITNMGIQFLRFVLSSDGK